MILEYLEGYVMKKKMRYSKYKKLKDKYEGIVNLVASLRLIIFVVMIVSFILKYYY